MDMLTSHTRFSICFIISSIIYLVSLCTGLRHFDGRKVTSLREEVREMFYHAYDGYIKYAYPYDELRPLSCDGVDTWGSYSLTLIDALDTLAVMGNFTEFQRVAKILTSKENFDININVSVFETNIRLVGGLISAHLLSYKTGMEVEPGWPCNGPLLRLAEDMARRLLPAFDTSTGMPYGTVNLRHGIPPGETSVTCTAGVGTFIVEFGTLSRLTGDPIYEQVALRALHSLWRHRSQIGLFGNHVDVVTGRWTATDAGIGAAVDSFYEYLVKGSQLLQRPELMQMFVAGRESVEKYLAHDDWHFWATMQKGQVTMPIFQNLQAFWPGLLSLIGDIDNAMKSLHNYHQVWKQYGFTPEFYNVAHGEAGTNREGYPLRPELIESVMYLHRATGDPYLLEVGEDILRSIQHSAKTLCGFATVKDVRTHKLEDRMESFFLAETTKYLYLLFDPDNFIHNSGRQGSLINTPVGQCVIDAGGYIFNTEAHPIDPSTLHCCTGYRETEVKEQLQNQVLDILDPSVHRRFKGLHVKHASNGSGQTRIFRGLRKKQPRKTESVSASPSEQASNVSKEDLQKNENKNLSVEHSEGIPVNIDDEQEIHDGHSEDISPLNIDNKPEIHDGHSEDIPPVNIDEEEEMQTEAKEVETAANEMEENSVEMEDVVLENDKSTVPEGGNVEAKNEQVKQKISPKLLEKVAWVNTGSAEQKVRSFHRKDLKPDTSPAVESPTRIIRTEDNSDSRPNFSSHVVVSSAKTDGESNVHVVDAPFLSSQLFSIPFLQISSPKRDFDAQILLEKTRLDLVLMRNHSWERDFSIMACPAQKYLQRLAIMGEVFP